MKKIFVFLAGLILFCCGSLVAVEAPKPVAAALRPVVEYDDAGARDPFQGLIEAPNAQGGQAAPKATDKQRLDLAKFSVQGVISGSGTPCAIINGAVVKVGSVVLGAKIMEIDKTGITLLYQDETYVLLTPAQASLFPLKEEKQGGRNEK